MPTQFAVDHHKIAQFCRQHGIVKLSFFGSVVRDEPRPDSDIDVLVEFDPERIPTLLDMAAMQEDLSELLGRRADLRTPEDLSRYFRDEVLATAEVQYVRE